MRAGVFRMSANVYCVCVCVYIFVNTWYVFMYPHNVSKLPLSWAVNSDDDNVCFNLPNVPVLSGVCCAAGASSGATICENKFKLVKFTRNVAVLMSLNMKYNIFVISELNGNVRKNIYPKKKKTHNFNLA